MSTLIERIEKHLRQLPAHCRNREQALLLSEALEALKSASDLAAYEQDAFLRCALRHNDNLSAQEVAYRASEIICRISSCLGSQINDLSQRRRDAEDKLKGIAALGKGYVLPENWDYRGMGCGPSLRIAK